MISVIVPVYNVEKYLERCVKSILAQTYNDIEILLVDDGSTDSSSKLCDDLTLKDSRVSVIHKKNGGLVSARKAGFEAAKGEYIMSVDSDDWIDSNMCSDMLDAMLKNDADFVASGYIFRNSNKIISLRKLSDSIIDLSLYNASNLIQEWMDDFNGCQVNSTVFGKLFKSDIIKQSYSNVPNDMQLGEDFVNYLNLIAISKKIVCISNVYYNYMENEKSLTHLKGILEIGKLNYLAFYCRNIITDKYDIDETSVDKWLRMRVKFALDQFLSQNKDSIRLYSFPVPASLYGKKIIIYGAGKVGQDYITQFSKYANIHIVSWVDKNYDNYSFEYRKVESVKSINEKSFDYVIISVLHKDVADEIKQQLLQIGIAQNKILWESPVSHFA